MKIATYNINSLRTRLPLLKEWLGRERPDVVCLQETKVTDDLFPVEELKAGGYDSVFRGEKTYNGVAILSRTPLAGITHGFQDGSGATRLIAAEVAGVSIVNSYIPQGQSPFSEKYSEKLSWIRALYENILRRFSPQTPLIWAGDFNIAPSPDDVFDPVLLDGHVSFNDEVRALLEQFRAWGMVDVFRRHHEGGGHYSFWEYTIRNAVRKGLGWRIDHIWATRPVAERSAAAWIDIEMRLAPKPSDHAPVIAVFEGEGA